MHRHVSQLFLMYESFWWLKAIVTSQANIIVITTRIKSKPHKQKLSFTSRLKNRW